MADSESNTHFTKAGECLDEVVFLFDNRKKLYVSQNFLYYVSSVFKSMFEHDFKEKETRTVTLKGKLYEDFLNFLLCLHPDAQRPIDKDNVLSIVHLAEEYQAKAIVRKSKDYMSEWLQSEFETANNSTSILQKLQGARTCLRILATVETLSYSELVEKTCKVIGHFGHAIFTGTVSDVKVYGTYRGRVCKPQNNDVLVDCKTLFNKLPETLKYKLMLERLRLHDDLEMHKP